MNLLKDTFANLSKQNIIFNIEEDFKNCNISIKITNPDKKLMIKDVRTINDMLFDNDRYSLTLKLDDDIPHFGSSSNFDELLDILEIVNDDIEDSEFIIIDYQIQKNFERNSCSIYSLNDFINGFYRKELFHILNIFDDIFFKRCIEKIIIMDSNYTSINYSTNLFSITSFSLLNNTNTKNLFITDRKSILTRKEFNTNSQSFSAFNFIPEDFDTTLEIMDCPLGKIFQTLKTLLSATYLSNTSNFQANNVNLVFWGHHHKNIDIDFHSTNFEECAVFFDIYRWVYNSNSNTSDKIALSREVISRFLNIEGLNNLKLTMSTLDSVKSAHSIYIKENVEKYIETKNKVAELTTELSIRSKGLTDFIVSSFRNNNLTLVGFFASVIVINSINENNNVLFSIETLIITWIFILISSIYLFITLKQVNKDLSVNKEYFISIKNIYADIFNIEELDKLFNKDILFSNQNYIKQTKNAYRNVWITEVVILSATSLILTYFSYNDINDFKDQVTRLLIQIYHRI